MSVTVRIPTPLRRITNGQDKVSVDGQDLEEVVAALEGELGVDKMKVAYNGAGNRYI